MRSEAFEEDTTPRVGDRANPGCAHSSGFRMSAR